MALDIDLNKDKYNFKDLNDIMSFLLGDNGCPWDKSQTHSSVMECLLEECYEVIDAVEKDDKGAMCEELGDVLLQVVFNAKMSEKDNGFTIDDIVDGISRKMISRHTHIFGGAGADNESQALDIWEKNKKKEKGYSSVKESMELVPKTFPSLMRAQKIQKKAAKAGFEEGDIFNAVDDAMEALLSFKNSLKNENSVQKSKYGEFLLKSANISRFLKINPELALTNAIETYINMFKNFESASEENEI